MSDLISRQAAIDTVIDWLKDRMEDKKNGEPLTDRLKHLPSVQRDTDEWCSTCSEYDTERHCCPRFNRVIREAMKDAQPEIIRCKDCIYLDRYVDGIEKYQWDGFCSCWARNTYEDWYCSRAERKGEQDGNQS